MLKWINNIRNKYRKNNVLIRVCVGCVLPYNAKLIGTGTYQIININGKISEQYYDYIIHDEDLEDFLNINKEILIKYKLLDEEPQENKKENKNPVEPTTLRGWDKKNNQ